ncbi:hypothetical protein [Streptomyces sp. NRRL S-920]|uniref:hypothetical protein n=1 Tax=Streptomyces sp. NRRL S-920 TaxID=1463921 RepID=UPI00131C912D|nr:hypothetical protein [Streptomyces sp. NRRL S-920]
MSSKKRTAVDGREARWRKVPCQWRRPQPLEVTEPLASISLVASVAGYVPEGPATVGATVAFALHAVATLATRCVRRTRE